MSIGRLTRVPLRDVWKHEAADFTAWLQNHVDVLSEALDIDLVSAEREQPVGDFSVDLVAQDDRGRNVVIENQLEPSDHRHLGQVLTYLATLDVEVAVWVVSKARPEHVNAVSWLNQETSCSFYLVQVEAVRIDDSAPAALFTLIVGPSPEIRAAGATKKEITQLDRTRSSFWSQLLELANRRSDLHASASTGHGYWVGAPAGLKGLHYVYAARKNDARVELYIETMDAERNRRILNALRSESGAIERAFGGELEWTQGGQACQIRYWIGKGGLEEEARWPAVIEGMVDAMERLVAAIGPHLHALAEETA